MTKGNPELFEQLGRRFVSGPIDWKKEWGMRWCGAVALNRRNEGSHHQSGFGVRWVRS
jgi:hypothetical protein